MSDPSESDDRIRDSINGSPLDPQRDLPALALQAAAERRDLERCHRVPGLHLHGSHYGVRKEGGDDDEAVRRWAAIAIAGRASALSDLGIDQGASSRTGIMIGGLMCGSRHALGFESCLLLDGRIVECQHDAIREEHLS